jgi:hypothetical protein
LSRPELEAALLLLRKAQEDADAVKKLVPDTDMGETLCITQIDGGVQLD